MKLIDIPGVGPKMVAGLAQVGILRPEDLLFLVPNRYQDRTRVLPMRQVQPGQMVQVEGDIQGATVAFGRRRSLLCHLQDDTAHLTVRFFHFREQQRRAMHPGLRMRCFGEAKLGPKGLEMIHPVYQVFSPDEVPPLPDTLTPQYPAVPGVAQAKIQRALAYLKNHWETLDLEELLSPEILTEYDFPDLRETLWTLHFPNQGVSVHELMSPENRFVQRLAFEELLAHRVSLRRLRRDCQVADAPVLNQQGDLLRTLMAALPFTLTGAQQRVLSEIQADMAGTKPMMRLLQGDVGSGKTVVAVIAAVIAIESGCQVALMAPNTLLAHQHFLTMQQFLADVPVEIAWLSGSVTGKARQSVLDKIAFGDAQLIVGTQALFQEKVAYKRLGLMIVDEQHRFGVDQRHALREKGFQSVHQLVMSATPIPRTLAMTVYADLDISVIDDLPPGRKPIETVLISSNKRDVLMQRIAHAVAEGRQAYWVCTLIEESEALTQKSATDVAEQIQAALGSRVQVGLVHGRLAPAEKEQLMQDFAQGKLDILVATTVIEVGIDVKNASIMVIDGAERLGLSQIHQLRGRVGRGTAESFCCLLYEEPVSRESRERLSVIKGSSDGFAIAQADLEMRGPGDVLGVRQSGALLFRIADLGRDGALLPVVQHVADQVLSAQTEVADRLVARWLGGETAAIKV